MSYIWDMDLSERADHFERHGENLREALSALIGTSIGSCEGSINQVIWWLVETLRGAAKVAPFKKGDRVELVKTPDFTEAPNWKFYEAMLVPGATAVVDSVSLGSTGWTVRVLFDREYYWSDWRKEIVEIEPERRGIFTFRPESLRKAEAVK